MTRAGVVHPERRVDLDGGFAGRVRDGAGPPVLWVHGYTLDSGVWTSLWDRLPGHAHVGVDLPGHGGSPPSPAGEDLAGLAARIGAAAAGAGARAVVALSFGTLVAIELAARLPGAVDTVVLAAPTLGGGARDPGTRARYRTLLRCHERCGPGREVRDLWLHEDSGVFRHARQHPELWALLRATVDRHGWGELRDGGLHRLTSGRQDAALLARIRAATLVLVGEHELPASVDAATRIVDAVPGGRCAVLPGAGHLCLLEDPAAAAALIGPWLRTGGRR